VSPLFLCWKHAPNAAVMRGVRSLMPVTMGVSLLL
jgi:hypothetical protein